MTRMAVIAAFILGATLAYLTLFAIALYGIRDGVEAGGEPLFV